MKLSPYLVAAFGLFRHLQASPGIFRHLHHLQGLHVSGAGAHQRHHFAVVPLLPRVAHVQQVEAGHRCSVFFLRTTYSPEEDLRAKMAAVFAATSFPTVLNGTSSGASRGETASASLSWSSSLQSSIFPLHATPLTRDSGSLNPSHRDPKVYPASFLLFFRKLDF